MLTHTHTPQAIPSALHCLVPVWSDAHSLVQDSMSPGTQIMGDPPVPAEPPVPALPPAPAAPPAPPHPTHSPYVWSSLQVW
ncbi:MAG: hypothetical protein WCW31_03730 [Patescibacteria group bacterium]